MRRSTLFLSMFLLAGGMAFAQQQADIPKVISYQGMLTSSNGTPLPDGEYPVTVTMYGDELGLNPVWQDTYTASVRGGVFNLYLGSGTHPLPAPDKMNKPLWIGTQVAGSGEMRPLTRLSATPYAINVPDNAITTHKLSDGAVTADKVDMDYISGITVNGKTIAGKGTVLNIQGGEDIDIKYDDATQSLVIGSPRIADPDGTEDKRKEDRDLLGTPQDAWSLQGDGVNVPGAFTVFPAPGDWLGTSAISGIPFELRTNGEQIMVYRQSAAGTTPNVIGGGIGNAVGAGGIGNVIAGGGGISAAPNIIIGDRFNTISGGEGNTIDNTFSNDNTIGGGLSNRIGSATAPANGSTIAGGASNAVETDFGAVGGGIGNQVFAPFGAIGGGNFNQVLGPFSTVGGGQNNVASLNNSTVGGGFNNQIQAPDGVIGGGRNNQVFAPVGTISGGEANSVFGGHASIGGGLGNQATAPFSTIGGGQGNLVTINDATIGGGAGNQLQGPGGTIGGGQGNLIGPLDYSTIGGGLSNEVQGARATIGGGELNVITGDLSLIGGGQRNRVQGRFGVVGGGEQNQVNPDYAIIGGGQTNVISPNGPHSVIGGGVTNIVLGPRSVIGGGEFNQVGSDRSVIGGGSNNNVAGPRSFIGGGEQNSIALNNSVIGGGFNNISAASYTVIGGGSGNRNEGIEATIGGGTGNRIEPGAAHGTISGGGGNVILNNLGRGIAASITGGERLTAQSYGQVVMGVGNIPKGNVAPGGAPNNDPILIVGNGTAGGTSNAFEVSYNGHSTVYHSNGAAAPVFLGSTYIDNVVYSWGEVTAAGGRLCDFGVTSVTRMGPGWYRVRMNIQTPNGTAVNLTCGSVTATLSSNAPPSTTPINSCRFIRTSRIGAGNIFDVYISQQTIVGGVLSCTGVDDGFVFKVTGRP